MRRGVKKGLVITGIVFGVIVCFVLAVGITSRVGNEANMKYAAELEKVVVDDPLPAPFIDEETGYYTFTADRDVKVLQLTDVHIGGGAFSLRKDMMAMNAVYDLVSYTKPDLIIVTGDMAYPVPFSSGSFNNLAPTKIFVERRRHHAIARFIRFSFLCERILSGLRQHTRQSSGVVRERNQTYGRNKPLKRRDGTFQESGVFPHTACGAEGRLFRVAR